MLDKILKLNFCVFVRMAVFTLEEYLICVWTDNLPLCVVQDEQRKIVHLVLCPSFINKKVNRFSHPEKAAICIYLKITLLSSDSRLTFFVKPNFILRKVLFFKKAPSSVFSGDESEVCDVIRPRNIQCAF